MTTGWATCRGRATRRRPGITIDADGRRRRAGRPAQGGAPILAVGDFFTFGDEVNDGQTWPAQLQRMTGRRVLNAGVSGYGFDQIVLRAEQFAAKYKPSAIVVSFIADDISRTEMRRLWSADKPWFELDKASCYCAAYPCRRAPIRAAPDFWQRRWAISCTCSTSSCAASTSCTTGSATTSACTPRAPASAWPAV